MHGAARYAARLVTRRTVEHVAASYAPRAARAADAGVGANPSAPMAVRLRERGTRHGWSSAAVLWNAVTGLNRRSGLIDVRSSVVP